MMPSDANKSAVMSLLPRVLLKSRFYEISLALESAADGDYQLRILPVSYPSLQYAEDLPMTVRHGRASMGFQPLREQEYRFVLFRDEAWVAEASVYAVEDDLYRLNPYRGDFHIHSLRSDGAELPAEVAAQGRVIGLDIMALTDHGQYQPSKEAIAAFDGAALDICLCPGEEIHAPGNPVHIINFGGANSVNDLFNDPKYQLETTEIQANLPILRDGCNPYEYASSLWVFRKIKEYGGLSIFCHPYWRNPYRNAPQEFYISEGLTSQIFADRPFDAYEVLGGYSLTEQDSNTLQTARYHEERQKAPLPIVGVSDAHGCYRGLFGWYNTIVFSSALTLDDIKNGIITLHSVAVEMLPNREPRVHGPMRLVSYALFLLREYFPHHDALCAKEGRQMMAWLHKDPLAQAELLKLSGQTGLWLKKCFGR